MLCLSIAALAMRLAASNFHAADAEPGLFIESSCGIEAGAFYRDGQVVVDAGLKLRPFHGPFWLRAGAEGERVTRISTVYPAHPAGGISIEVLSITRIARGFAFRARASAGADIRLAGHLYLSPEIEATRGGRLLLSVSRRF